MFCGATFSLREEKDYAVLSQEASDQLAQLTQSIQNHQLHYGAILQSYATLLALQKPEIRPLIQQLSMLLTPESPALLKLRQQLAEASTLYESGIQAEEIKAFTLLEEVRKQSQLDYYDRTLIDVINVLADLSEGTLTRIQPQEAVISSQEFSAAQLVGNPLYGTWKEHNGTSLWEWYATYAMLGSLLGTSSIEYKEWLQKRPWSVHTHPAWQPSQGPNWLQRMMPATPGLKEVKKQRRKREKMRRRNNRRLDKIQKALPSS